ncbi:hypothetical protein AMES_7113 [Amycolatopsis mediterranei S699]|uniref:Uncharacterized protein n=2 Tax=Amycolatopsis mediterranei TaxID=33910 RepID=A0A0H3DH23_AMYMU|nr:hypothetical protein [Amycolatopsis mediterranei]ADJ48939.1 hypothetical protein AMED_7222 [Amycolatopsis mediterranei U32]AEK45888.1 hypothetical protein RAM_37095 [Amycolatopsis mediterranei S699]AFO80647.1 hypothetical protein AMES_7113 [Amycolatopsis mediterranei S699]AGT87775.1 hypothetical protein B737_7113 [Amycolatopsis mediterranei RB]KDU93942.1 hypothetical protein DV36_00980 [Amycolatopsis mediterranei]
MERLLPHLVALVELVGGQVEQLFDVGAGREVRSRLFTSEWCATLVEFNVSIGRYSAPLLRQA